MRQCRLAFLSAVAFGLQGCAIGYNTTFFMTKTNFGLDVESKPPTAEISIARREGVIEPSFDSQTLPVVAGFSGTTNPFSNYLFGVSSVFAGGDAAAIVTNLSGKDLPPSRLCLKKKPVGSFLWWRFPRLAPQENEVRPLFFGTDTLFGLKLAWDGLTSAIPDTIKAGFHRKEIAIAPVNGRTVSCTTPEPENAPGEFEVWMAPFLAWIDLNVKTGKPSDTHLGYAQGIATGTAATNWASHPKIQQLVLERARPEAAADVKFNTDPKAPDLRKRISTWLNTDPNNRKNLKAWLSQEGLASPEAGTEVSWLWSAPLEQLNAAITNFNIP